MLRALALSLLFLPALASAEEIGVLKLTGTHRGLDCVLIFLAAYGLVMTEEFIQLRKSKPVVLVAGIIWAQAAHLAGSHGVPDAQIHQAFDEFAALMMFLLVAMTYINPMAERNVFEAIRA